MRKSQSRHRLLFEFARELKAIPALAHADAADLKPHVKCWHARALSHICTKPFEETWFDFAEGWRRVKSPKGEGPIDMAFAKARGVDVPEMAAEYEHSELQLLVMLCRELQRVCGDGPFFLATRTAGRLLNDHHATVSRWLRGLQADKILKLETRGSIDKQKASQFCYIAGDV